MFREILNKKFLAIAKAWLALSLSTILRYDFSSFLVKLFKLSSSGIKIFFEQVLDTFGLAEKESDSKVDTFTPIKSKQAKAREEQDEKEAEEEPESSNIVMVVEKDKKALPLYINLWVGNERIFKVSFFTIVMNSEGFD